MIAAGTSPHEATCLTLAEFRSGNILGQYMSNCGRRVRRRQSHRALQPETCSISGRICVTPSVSFARIGFTFSPGLTLGIGATVTIFGLVEAALIKPSLTETSLVSTFHPNVIHNAAVVPGCHGLENLNRGLAQLTRMP
jgi:hypothetical protein